MSTVPTMQSRSYICNTTITSPPTTATTGNRFSSSQQLPVPLHAKRALA